MKISRRKAIRLINDGEARCDGISRNRGDLTDGCWIITRYDLQRVDHCPVATHDPKSGPALKSACV